MNENDYLNFKYLLEYFVSHLEWIVHNDTSFIGYKKYIEPRLKKNEFKITGQGYNGGRIQEQISDWDHFEGTKVCINITYNQMIGYHSKFCYLNWLWTGINIIAEWEDKRIVGLYQELFIEKKKPEKSIWKSLNMSKSIQELGLFDNSSTTNSVLKSFYKNFRAELLQHNLREQHKKKMAQIEDKIKLLKYKKQIILQGPPGTGKTREAKTIAKNIILDNINIDTISNYINVGDSLPNASGITDYYKIKTIDLSKKEVILVSDKSKIEGNFAKFDRIIERLKEIRENTALINTNGQHPYEIAVAKFIFLNVLKSNEQFKFVQFHPSYTYEDFVRGIVAKPNDDGDGILYEAENKTLGRFADDARKNYKSAKQSHQNLKDDEYLFEQFRILIITKLAEDEKFDLTENIYISEIDDKRFKYKGDNWKRHPKGLSIRYSEFKKVIEINPSNRQEIVKNTSLKSLTRSHATYFFELFTRYKEFCENNKEFLYNDETHKNYILLIDEINRADLSSVLGELIYALEYRGEEVESMYEIDGSQELILPPNLFIIGTMNTADRSVGHIDYAIRRRFAFVDILPKNLTTELGTDFKKDIFTKVSELFIENYNPEMEYGPEESRLNRSQHLSEEFEPKDVWLGHSYFIQHYEYDANGIKDVNQPIDFTLRLEYEIKPILREYVKDGILKPSALEIIENLGK